jgi:adenylate cyclase
MRIVAVPLDVVQAPFDSILTALLLGGGGALLISALAGAVLSRSLTRPIRDLVAAAGRVAAGDYETEVRVDSSDEMGTLAEAFNEMTRGLLQREQYRSVLNKVVSPDVAKELMKGDVDLGGENREVSVLFADIRGFTPLTEGMEPQEVIRVLNECMEHLSRAVDAEDGVVDKFIGDEIMAVFGAPVTQADHAHRAVSAAVRMRDGMAEMNATRVARGDAPLGLGIGIASGVAVAGNMGSSDRLNYTVLGETVNLAARLTDQAEAGEILVSGQTVEKAGAGVVAPCVGQRSLKGFSSDVEVFSVECLETPSATPH